MVRINHHKKDLSLCSLCRMGCLDTFITLKVPLWCREERRNSLNSWRLATPAKLRASPLINTLLPNDQL